MMEGEQTKRISKYSSGVSIQIRLDTLWRDANNHSRIGLFLRWNNDLDTIWRELARDISEDEYEDYKDKFDKFDKELIKLGNFEDRANEGFNPLSKDQILKRDKQYKVLSEKELFLKRLENHLGKGTTFVDGDESDWE